MINATTARNLSCPMSDADRDAIIAKAAQLILDTDIGVDVERKARAGDRKYCFAIYSRCVRKLALDECELGVIDNNYTRFVDKVLALLRDLGYTVADCNPNKTRSDDIYTGVNIRGYKITW